MLSISWIARINVIVKNIKKLIIIWFYTICSPFPLIITRQKTYWWIDMKKIFHLYCIKYHEKIQFIQLHWARKLLSIDMSDSIEENRTKWSCNFVWFFLLILPISKDMISSKWKCIAILLWNYSYDHVPKTCKYYFTTHAYYSRISINHCVVNQFDP